MNQTTKRLAESAMLIAIATVLSELQIPWVLGGGITACSMLPIVILAYRHGTPWGIVSALTFSLIQLVLGMSNVQYATNFLTAAAIVLFDYVIAFTVIGFAGVFKNKAKNPVMAIVLGIVVTFTLRFICHFISGYFVWEALWPNEYGYASAVWSLIYNGSYMLPEIIITSIVAAISFNPLKKFWLGEDLKAKK